MSNPVLRVMRILWAALTFSVFIYGAVLFVVRQQQHPDPLPQMYVPVFAVVAFGCAVLSFVLPRRIYMQAARSQEIPVAPSSGGGSMPSGMFQDAGPARKLAAHPAEASRRAYALFQTQFILSLALSEAVALFGFALGFLGFAVAQFAPFFVVAVILMAMRFPTEERVFALFEAATGVHLGARS